MHTPRMMQRCRDGDRMNHGFITMMFVLAAPSGLAFFHPALFFFSHLFGGGSWDRILHRFLGLLLVLGFVAMYFRLREDKLVNDADREAEKTHGCDAARPQGRHAAGGQVRSPPTWAPDRWWTWPPTACRVNRRRAKTSPPAATCSASAATSCSAGRRPG